MAKVRATRSVTADKLVGKNVLVYINFGEGATEAAPVWTLIGGQRSASLSMTADDIDASNKASSGWAKPTLARNLRNCLWTALSTRLMRVMRL